LATDRSTWSVEFESWGNVEIMWELEALADLFERLSSFSRLILHDPRGTGLSGGSSFPNLETRARERRQEAAATRDGMGSWARRGDRRQDRRPGGSVERSRLPDREGPDGRQRNDRLQVVPVERIEHSSQHIHLTAGHHASFATNPWTYGATADSVLPTDWEVIRMASKDKNTKKSMEKKPAQKTLKEKRQAKRAK
jgi:hypothetical protein